MNTTTGEEFHSAVGGSLWKGAVLALICQTAHLLFIVHVPTLETRIVGYLLFALVQFAYLVPLAIYFQRHGKGLTSSGILMAAGACLLIAGIWLGYASVHGQLPTISPN